MTTRQQMIAVLQAVQAIKDTIYEVPEGVPLGPMYAAVMGKMSYETFMAIIQLLIDGDKIVVSNHVARRKS